VCSQSVQRHEGACQLCSRTTTTFVDPHLGQTGHASDFFLGTHAESITFLPASIGQHRNLVVFSRHPACKRAPCVFVPFCLRGPNILATKTMPMATGWIDTRESIQKHPGRLHKSGRRPTSQRAECGSTGRCLRVASRDTECSAGDPVGPSIQTREKSPARKAPVLRAACRPSSASYERGSRAGRRDTEKSLSVRCVVSRPTPLSA
jgi:hypothetical protein